jgi:hypothetical protein
MQTVTCKLMRPLRIIIALLFLVGCEPKVADKKLNKIITTPKTGLSESTDSLLSTFKNNWKFAVLIEPDSHLVDLDSLNNLIQYVKFLDITNYDDFHISSKICNGVKEVFWSSNNNTNLIKQIVRQSFDFNYVDSLLGNHNNVLITDYEIYRRSKPFYVMLRICESDMFERLVIDSLTYLPEKHERIIDHKIYKPFFYLEAVGFEETQDLFESKKKACR